MIQAHIQVSKEHNIGVIRLFRPQIANALNQEMIDELAKQMEAFDKDEHIRVIVVKGSANVFATGADIGKVLENNFTVWDKFKFISKPIIAAVNGSALDKGFELVLHSDIIIAAEDAVFGFPEVIAGIIPSVSSTQRLKQTIGRVKALEFIWLGEQMSAREALQYGLINRVVVSELVEEVAMDLAKKLSKRSPISLSLIKEAIENISID